MKSNSTVIIIVSFIITTLLIVGIVFLVLNNTNLIKDTKEQEYKDPYFEVIYPSGEESGEEEVIEEEPPYLGPKIFSGDSRSVAVMIDNDQKAAWPHAGLNNAYMIYEITVEGSATRLCAFFKKDNLPDLVGPIRSCRHYFLDYVQEHDAIYCHIGQSTQGGEALKSRGINNINGIYDDYYKRIKDVDKTWHNVFSSKEQIEKYIKKKGYRDVQNQDCILTYNQKDTDIENGQYADKVICKFSSVQTTSFDYNEENKNYEITMKTYQTELPHVEKYTGNRYVAKNILIYQVGNQSIWNAWDDHREEDNKKRQEIFNTGSGTGYFITNGKAIKMQWSKPTHASKTTYKDMDGNEIKFNDGTTWVEIMPLEGKITIENHHKTVTPSGEISGEVVS